jgi:hypothetical protein
LTGKSKTKFCSFLVQCLTKFNQILINSSLADGKCIQKISYEYVWYFLSYLAHRQTHIHTYTRTHIHTYTHTHIHTYTHTHIHTYTHTYTHIHTHIHTYTHTHIQTQMVIIKRAYTLRRNQNILKEMEAIWDNIFDRWVLTCVQAGVSIILNYPEPSLSGSGHTSWVN